MSDTAIMFIPHFVQVGLILGMLSAPSSEPFDFRAMTMRLKSRRHEFNSKQAEQTWLATLLFPANYG